MKLGRQTNSIIIGLASLGLFMQTTPTWAGPPAKSESKSAKVRLDDTPVTPQASDSKPAPAKVVPPAAIPLADLASAHIEETPDTPTIETLVAVLNDKFPRADRMWSAADTLKNLIVTLAYPDGKKETLAIGVPGDRDVDMNSMASPGTPRPT